TPGRGDVPPLAVGVELHGFTGAGFAVPAVGVGVDLRFGVAVDDQGAVGAGAVGVQLAVHGRPSDVEGGGDLFHGVLAGVVHQLGLVELALGELGAPAADPAAG